VDKFGLPYPAHQAWLAGLTEFLGGILIFVGLLSRLWGLGLAVVMGMAFYMTSLDKLGTYFNMEDVGQFNMLFCQLGLFVMAFGVFLTGPGRLSLDQMLFGRSSPPPQQVIVTQPPPSPRPV
jgi:putative oxidoreductase